MDLQRLLNNISLETYQRGVSAFIPISLDRHIKDINRNRPIAGDTPSYMRFESYLGSYVGSLLLNSLPSEYENYKSYKARLCTILKM